MNKGKLLVFSAPSGSGKTTFLTLLGGLRTAYNGSIKVLGKELVGADYQTQVNNRRQIGFIFQAHNLLGFLTARQNVQMAVELNNSISQSTAIAQSEDMLTSVGLQERVNHYPDNLSGGQKQIILLLRNYFIKNRIIILDEPTSALDDESRKTVIEIIKEISNNSTLVIITHDENNLNIVDKKIKIINGQICN
jgi:putative ABC transport system ATP-binding protein